MKISLYALDGELAFAEHGVDEVLFSNSETHSAPHSSAQFIDRQKVVLVNVAGYAAAVLDRTVD